MANTNGIQEAGAATGVNPSISVISTTDTNIGLDVASLGNIGVRVASQFNDALLVTGGTGSVSIAPTAGTGGSSTGNANLQLNAEGTGSVQTGTGLQRPKVAPTYSASITPNAQAGDWQTITVANSTAFTINAPSNPPAAGYTQDLVIEVLNSSGGVMGAITWNAAFVLVGGAFTNPASTKRRYIRFGWNGSSWIELNRASADY